MEEYIGPIVALILIGMALFQIYYLFTKPCTPDDYDNENNVG